MKKILSFILLLGSFALMNAQQIGIKYNNQIYHDGESFTVVLSPSAHDCSAISFVNQAPTLLADMVISMEEVEQNGIECWALCTGDMCIPGLTTNPINLPPNSTYNEFRIDINVEGEHPYSIYNLQISNGTVTCSVVVRFQTDPVGIDDVAGSRLLKAFPNPASQSVARIEYDVEMPATLIVVDMQGRTVKQLPIQGNGTAVLDDLTAGTYAYGIIAGNKQSKMQKLIVK